MLLVKCAALTMKKGCLSFKPYAYTMWGCDVADDVVSLMMMSPFTPLREEVVVTTPQPGCV